MTPRRSSKRVGRPRLDTTATTTNSTAILSPNRRTQVRRAQRTYRLKKEAVFRKAIDRAEQLEARFRIVREEVAGLLADVATEDHQLHPTIHTRLKRLHEILLSDDGDDTPVATSTNDTTPLCSSSSSSTASDQSPSAHHHHHQQPTYPNNNHPLIPNQPLTPLPTKHHTYAFHEPRFLRKLHRYTLEHAYRLFTDPRSNPSTIYRVFRLVPCIRDPQKTQPRFQQLLTGGCTDPLEVPGLPFYGIGGAGTHFRGVDGDVPQNRRMPGRVLGVMSSSSSSRKSRDDMLEMYGLGGTWFDCRDVEGFLGLMGVDITHGGMFLRCSGIGDAVGEYVLDVEGFFSRLLPGLVILGRTPGFREVDVRRALQGSVRRVDRI
ncbi:uncharacterized protein AKAW2_80130S [Aspergillus luchuensis]|uniref:5-methylthioadenosine/S-adenosylhomocysteine deaminase n1 n=1 Tax=Aspergillus kawachii TaxID=1069201 RepID=A0A146F7X8_ASPKA|nr:uncharacterized protein AKAW2_80130S [Aspergillus luchuensis]BCS04329.1 hypothetical protein AKAW2_80130S [Aspergillus luchuensis]GAT22115.1 5-methylthioadenosine/S-adenosylhomocysteine deaminase n1 [Aspergillus luchuensis]